MENSTFLWKFAACLGLLAACGEDDGVDAAGSTGHASETSDEAMESTGDEAPGPDPSDTGAPDPGGDESSGGEPPGDDTTGGTTGAPSQPLALDVLFVVDNTVHHGPSQRKLARAADELVELLRGSAPEVDVQVMVTSTDTGNPLCTPFEPDHYDPAAGAPVATACLERLQDFTPIVGSERPRPDLCEDVCPVAMRPEGTFVHFTESDDNVVEGSAAEALACLLPQGINGCGYESPLFAMQRALDPGACWNQPGGCAGGGGPFLRPGADLAVVIATNELDCSLVNYAVMEDPAYQNVDPDNGQPRASSALCFNAGVTCDTPDDADFGDCTASGTHLAPVDIFVDLLEDQHFAGKRVVLVPIVGVDPAGLGATSYRAWVDGTFPAGDIVPLEAEAGITAADKTFDFGLGPGCTAADGEDWVQAVPPVRLRELCEATEALGGQCCLHSQCMPGFVGAMSCLADAVAAP